jgi:hypothetical protein
VAAVLRLGVGERGVTEIMAVSEHVSSLCAGAAALQLPPDVPERQGEGPAAAVQPPAAGGECLEEIAEWSRENLSLEGAPAFWQLLAHQPRFLQATWEKDRLVLGAGRLDEQAKLCIAFAVAAFRQSAYWISYYTELLRRRVAGHDRALIELTASVMHYVSFNTVAHAMMLGARDDEMTAERFEERSG